MFCENCGLAIPDEVSFCPNCGQSAGQGLDEQMQPPYYNSAQPGNQSYDAYDSGNRYHFNTSSGQAPYQQNLPYQQNMPPVQPYGTAVKSNSSNRPLIIAIISIMALLIIGIIFLILRLTIFKPDDNGSQKAQVVTTSDSTSGDTPMTTTISTSSETTREETSLPAVTSESAIEETTSAAAVTESETQTEAPVDYTSDPEAFDNWVEGEWLGILLPDGTRSVYAFTGDNTVQWLLTYPGEDMTDEGYAAGNWPIELISDGFYSLENGNIVFVWTQFDETLTYGIEIIDEATIVITDYYDGGSFSDTHVRIK